MTGKNQKREVEEEKVTETTTTETEEVVVETEVENDDGQDRNQEPAANEETEPMFELDESDDEEEPENSDEDEGQRAPIDDATYFKRELTRLADSGLTLKPDVNPYRMAVGLADKVLELREEKRKLKADAKLGEQYRDDLIKDALKEGVRSHGEEFDSDHWENLLRRTTTTIEDIRLFRTTWQAEGDKRFGQGRKTKERAGHLTPVDQLDDASFVDQA